MTDPNYCLWLFSAPCKPLDWWASGAAWAQAILTVLTFAATVAYQAIAEQRRYVADRNRDLKQETNRISREMALTKVVGARELRRWRRAIRAHLAKTYDTPRLEAEGVISAARNISWQGDVHELSLLGEVGALFVSLISVADQTIDMLDSPSLGSAEQKVGLEECLSTIREQWKGMDGSITDALTTLETFNKK